MRDDEVFGGLGDEARDVLVALVSCGGHVTAADLAPLAGAWAAANGRTVDPYDAALDALGDAYCHTVPNEHAVLLAPTDPSAVERWLVAQPPLLRTLVASAVCFDQVRWAAALGHGDDAGLFAAARRTWDTRSVRWRPRPPGARKGAPPFFPPQRDPLARLTLVATLVDRNDAEATAWVAGLLPRTRQEWVDHGREAVVAALPALAGLLPDGAAALVAQAVAGDERHGFGWADLAGLHRDRPGVFPAEVWDDVRKRYARWAKRRQTYPMNDAARAEMTETAADLGVRLDEGQVS
ncbi:MAG TPA: hypothetical protein VNQ77_12910 [Frankiaceae bacterium]|nr:hypothetical protein [Frankiaceae bacterium]